MRGGGKRLRARLLLSSYCEAGGKGDVTGLAAAVELIHAYSLVHDDLPCMDDDDVRRGTPTVHRVFGTQRAVRAGLALLPIAIDVALDSCGELRLPGQVTCTIVRRLAQAAGGGGMIAGQLGDLESEGRAISLTDLEVIHAAKTGALIQASVVVGGLAAQCAGPQLKALEIYGERIGLAYQIVDDVLDVTATSAVLGKTAGRDVTLNKSTYPSLLGVDEARRRAQKLVAEGKAALEGAGMLGVQLAELGQFAVARVS